MKLLTGVLLGCFVLAPLLVFGYVKAGFLSLATSAKPFPLERFMAKTALRASMGQARDTPDPLTATEDNLAAGVKEYREHCAVCHGLPGQRTAHPRSPHVLKEPRCDNPRVEWWS